MNLFILRDAQKELAQLSAGEYERVKAAIYRLGEDPRLRGCRKLSGRAGWRIRVGNLRVVYEIDDGRQIVTVLHIGHRRDVYH